MSDAIITVENLGKRYLVGHQRGRRERSTTFRDVLVRNAHALLRKAGDMFHGRPLIQGDEVEEFWALKGVSFDVKRGEVLGIIGSNGAGKSTLLKILSRITEPTEGRIHLRGRVASLLEVGTGFHHELTGRENIFLNGAILGMNRAEIRKKFDEIVSFAEVEKFLDTPVKHYSSGMYVRLAFAVAAHLEPEILIVDEVLAVGDTAFQKKCLGKMQDVSTKEGRTVLFVSHNMGAVRKLCQRCVCLNSGRITLDGNVVDVINQHVTECSVCNGMINLGRVTHKNQDVSIANVRLFRNLKESEFFNYGDGMRIEVSIDSKVAIQASVELVIRDGAENPFAFFGTGITMGKDYMLSHGANWVRLEIDHIPFAVGKYFIDVSICITNVMFLEYRECCRHFWVEISDPENSGHQYHQKDKGSVYIPFTCSSSAKTINI